MSNPTRINVVPNPSCDRAGPKSYASLLKKYNFAPTTAGPLQRIDETKKSLKNAFLPKSKRSTVSVLRKVDDEGKKKPGKVEADDQQNDALYICPVDVGTPPQRMNLHFDTGTSGVLSCADARGKLWSTSLSPATRKADAGKHNIFDPKKSSTYRAQSGSSWKIKYGDGSTASGTVGTDNVTLGGLCVENQAVEIACKLSPQFTKGKGDGLLGLAFGKINTVKPTKVSTPVENMIKQSDISPNQELFTCYIGSWRDSSDFDYGESFYTFGYIDADVVARCGSAVHFAPIDASKGFWQFASGAASINGVVVPRAGNTAIADTGTSLALVSDDVCKAIYKSIPGAKFNAKVQGWVYPVDTKLEELPEVKFAVGQKMFAVQKEDLGFAGVGGGMQYGGIQSRGSSTFDILGDTWLKGVYAVFDVGGARFGCVQRVEGEQNLEVPGK